jgi:hypothetical protein
VPDRHDASGLDGERLDRGHDVLERLRPAAAVAQPPVLDVPRRPAAPREVTRDSVLQLAPVTRPPEAAVDENRDTDGLARGEQLAELGRVVPVDDPLRRRRQRI